MPFFTHSQLDCEIGPHWLTMANRFIQFLLAVQQLDYNYIIFDCCAGCHPISLMCAIFSNTLIFMSEKDNVSLSATDRLRNWIIKEESNTLHNLELIHEKDQIWQALIKQWYKFIRINHKQSLFLLNRSNDNVGDKILIPGKRWEILYSEKVASAYAEGITIIPNTWGKSKINHTEIDTVYLYVLVKIYQQIAERYGDNVEDIYILDEFRNKILEQIQTLYEQQTDNNKILLQQNFVSLQQTLQEVQTENEILHTSLDDLWQWQQQQLIKHSITSSISAHQEINPVTEVRILSNQTVSPATKVRTLASIKPVAEQNIKPVAEQNIKPVAEQNIKPVAEQNQISQESAPKQNSGQLPKLTAESNIKQENLSLSITEKQWQERVQILQKNLVQIQQEYQAANIVATKKYEELLRNYQKICGDYERLRQEYNQLQTNKNAESNRAITPKEGSSDELRRAQQERDSVLIQYRELYSRNEKLSVEFAKLQEQVTNHHLIEEDYNQLVAELNAWRDKLRQLRQQYCNNQIILDVLAEFGYLTRTS